MKKILPLLVILLTLILFTEAQEVKFRKADLQQKEPYKDKIDSAVTDTIHIKLTSKKEIDTLKLIIGKESTMKKYLLLNDTSNKTFRNDTLFFLNNEATVYFAITENIFLL